MAKLKLDDLVTPKPSSWARDFRIPPAPKLRDHLSGKSLLDGVASFDAAFEKWRMDSERSIADRLPGQASTSPTTGTTTPAAATTTTTNTPSTPVSVPSAGAVTSVNGQTGAVVLESDEIAEGGTNLYLTDANFLSAFRRLGLNPNYLAPGVTWKIPSQRNVVIYGEFQVDGKFQVDGHAAFLG